MVSGVLCQSCGIEAPTKYAEFNQNIGALVMRYSRKIKGNLCKRCVHKYFWKTTLITLAVGWLGTISIIIAPFFVLMNVCRYLGALRMPAVPADAKVPEASPAVMEKFAPHADEFFKRLNEKEEINDLARAVAPKIGLTPGQIIKCAAALAQQARLQQQQNRPTGGFPVIPIQQAKPIPVVPIAQPLAPLEEVSPPPRPQNPQIGLGT
jgi:hypothetical protein